MIKNSLLIFYERIFILIYCCSLRIEIQAINLINSDTCFKLQQISSGQCIKIWKYRTFGYNELLGRSIEGSFQRGSTVKKSSRWKYEKKKKKYGMHVSKRIFESVFRPLFYSSSKFFLLTATRLGKHLVEHCCAEADSPTIFLSIVSASALLAISLQHASRAKCRSTTKGGEGREITFRALLGSLFFQSVVLKVSSL